jgi:hypothetical protein
MADILALAGKTPGTPWALAGKAAVIYLACMDDFAGAICDGPNETTSCEASQELGRKIVPERENPLGRGSNHSVDHTGHSTGSECQWSERRRANRGEEPRWETVLGRRESEGADAVR